MEQIIGIVGPSGVGKGYAKAQIIEGFPDVFSQPIVATTREARPFPEPDRMAGISIDEFFRMKKSGEILFAHQPFGTGADHYGFLASSFTIPGKLITEVHIDNVVPFKRRFAEKVTLIGLVAQAEYLRFNLNTRASETEEQKLLRVGASVREIELIGELHSKGLIDHLVEANMVNRNEVMKGILISIVSTHLHL